MMTLKQRFFQYLIAIDQVWNTRIGSGYADETLSAYAHRKQGWRRILVNSIFFWQPDHCKKAYEAEVKRKHLPMEYRDDN